MLSRQIHGMLFMQTSQFKQSHPRLYNYWHSIRYEQQSRSQIHERKSHAWPRQRIPAAIKVRRNHRDETQMWVAILLCMSLVSTFVSNISWKFSRCQPVTLSSRSTNIRANETRGLLLDRKQTFLGHDCKSYERKILRISF